MYWNFESLLQLWNYVKKAQCLTSNLICLLSEAWVTSLKKFKEKRHDWALLVQKLRNTGVDTNITQIFFLRIQATAISHLNFKKQVI